MIEKTVWIATKHQWNFANAMTLSRALMAALIPIVYMLGEMWLVGLVFCAAISDGLDGWLARKRGEETPIGAVGDPLADKVFTDAFLIYATFQTELWSVAVLACITLLYDIDNTYQRRMDIANAFKGIAVRQQMPATWLSKGKTMMLFGFMLAVVYPQYLPFLTVEQFAVFCTALVLSSWWLNRKEVLSQLFR